MAIYNSPIITIKNIDNLVYRDKPYELQFNIKTPTLADNIIENTKYTNESNIVNKMEYEYKINKKEWLLDNKNTIVNFEPVEDNILQITGKKVLTYTYKVFFNNKIIKEFLTPINKDIDENIIILSSYFENFVDGNIKIEIYYGFHETKIETREYQLQLINTKPNIMIGDVINNKLDISIIDNESDDIQLNIKINNKNYFPINGGFTKTILTPYFYSTTFSSDELNIDPNDFNTPNNIITITVKDKYGAETQLHKSFVGEFYGLMFIDEKEKFLSTDSNNYINDKNILKELYLGNIKAGTIGEKKCVYLLNKTRNDLTNIQLHLDTTRIPKKTYVKIGKSILDNFEDMSDFIDFENIILKTNERIKFYIQGNTNVLSQGGGYGYIDVIADAVL